MLVSFKCALRKRAVKDHITNTTKGVKMSKKFDAIAFQNLSREGEFTSTIYVHVTIVLEIEARAFFAPGGCYCILLADVP